MTRAAIIAVGTELVLDGRSDTNGDWTARRLAAAGIETRWRVQVPDDTGEIARALIDAAGRFDLVIVTGGLGPTVDDVTLDGAAEAFGLPLDEDRELRESLERRYAGRGGRPPGWASRQARVPRGARILGNRVGTAVGLAVTRPGGCLVVLMPGVPSEMEIMLEEQLLPLLEKPDAGTALFVRSLRVAGLSESRLQETIADLIPQDGPLSLTLLASPAESSVIVRGTHGEEVERLHGAIAGRLGSAVFTQDLAEGLESAVGRTLARKGLTLSVAESCTGGLLSRLVTEVPGASEWFLQGWVVYSNESKRSALEIPASLIERCGAVSREVAAAMSESARRLSGADIGTSVTGIAGPGGATEGKPVGTAFIGLSSESGTGVTSHLFRGERSTIRILAARTALNRIRLET